LTWPSIHCTAKSLCPAAKPRTASQHRKAWTTFPSRHRCTCVRPQGDFIRTYARALHTVNETPQTPRPKKAPQRLRMVYASLMYVHSRPCTLSFSPRKGRLVQRARQHDCACVWVYKISPHACI